MTKSTLFTIFNPTTGKVVGETDSQSEADHINVTYMNVLKALPFSEFIGHCDRLRSEGNKSPYL